MASSNRIFFVAALEVTGFYQSNEKVHHLLRTGYSARPGGIPLYVCTLDDEKMVELANGSDHYTKKLHRSKLQEEFGESLEFISTGHRYNSVTLCSQTYNWGG